MLVEQGVPGFLFFLLIVGSMFYYAEKIYRRSEDKFYKVTAMACSMITIISGGYKYFLSSSTSSVFVMGIPMILL